VNVTTEGNSQSIQLYPNPVENELSVAGIEGNASIQIVTLEGKSLLNQTIKSNEKVNVTQLPAGLYIARITTADGKIEKKIVKQ
jgi:hypothetical protein